MDYPTWFVTSESKGRGRTVHACATGRCGVVAVGAGSLSWGLVDPDSFVLPQQLNTAQRRVQDLWKFHPAPGAVICQTWLLWLTLASSSA